MKPKRVFFQDDPSWIITRSLLGLFVLGIQIFILSFTLAEWIRGVSNFGHFISVFVIFAVASSMLIYPMLLSSFSWNVHMDTERVWMKGDAIAPKQFRVQFPVEAYYYEIVSITVEYSYKNSSGQSIRDWVYYGPTWSRKRYLVLMTDHGKKKRLHVSHYTDARLAEIIDEIASRCEEKKGKYDGRRAAQILFNLSD